MQWCSQGDLLAVAGMERNLLPHDPSSPPPIRNAIVKFYNIGGEHIYTLDTPAQVIVLVFFNFTANLNLDFHVKVGSFKTFSLSGPAPHHKSVLGSPGLSPLPGFWSCTVHFASGAQSCQPAATLPAGNCNCSKRGKRRGKAHHAISAWVLRYCCVHPHNQGNFMMVVSLIYCFYCC